MFQEQFSSGQISCVNITNKNICRGKWITKRHFLINDPCDPKLECVLKIGRAWERLVDQNNWCPKLPQTYRPNSHQCRALKKKKKSGKKHGKEKERKILGTIFLYPKMQAKF